MICRQKAGFTLIELLVYMGLLASIVIIAGHAFSDSTRFRVRTQNILRANQESENVAVLLKSDISQIGSKNSKEAGDAQTVNGEKRGDKFGSLRSDVYMDPANVDPDKRDFSSFEICYKDDADCPTHSIDFDSVFFRYVRFDNDGHYKAVEEAHWYVEGGVLKRTCRTIVGTSDCGNAGESREDAKAHAVEIASGVTTFKLYPVKPGNRKRLFPSSNDTTYNLFSLIPRKEAGYENVSVANDMGEIGASGTEQKIGGPNGPFFSNWTNEPGPANDHLLPEVNRKINQLIATNPVNNPVASWSSYCQTQGGNLRLERNVEYELSFSMTLPPSAADRSLLFIPGRDHMSVGFRSFETGEKPKKDGRVLIDDFMFFPPLDAKNGDGDRVMRFTVPDTVENACIAFTFAFYSPLASQGAITIKDLRLYRLPYLMADGSLGEVPIKEKQNVKAMKLLLEVARGGKNDEKGETNVIEIVIPTPSNGPSD